MSSIFLIMNGRDNMQCLITNDHKATGKIILFCQVYMFLCSCYSYKNMCFRLSFHFEGNILTRSEYFLEGFQQNHFLIVSKHEIWLQKVEHLEQLPMHSRYWGPIDNNLCWRICICFTKTRKEKSLFSAYSKQCIQPLIQY